DCRNVTVEGNLISGNMGDGIDLESASLEFLSFCDSMAPSSDNDVVDNLIGTDYSGLNPLGNGANGILIGSSQGGALQLPFDNLFEGNTIAFNGTGKDPNNRSGIRMPSTSSFDLEQLRNRITSNFIFSNVGLGIDLGALGVTENPGNINDGPNKLQNFPHVNSSNMAAAAVTTTRAKARGIAPAADGASITVSGTLSAKRNTAYTL